MRIPMSAQGMIDIEKALKDPEGMRRTAKTLPGQYTLLHGSITHIALAVNIFAESGWRVVSHSVSPGIPSPLAYVFMTRARP